MRSLVLSVVLLVCTVAHAAPLEVCVTAHESTQSLRREYHYRDARKAALSCAQATCPKLIRDDCSRWYGELDESTPSVVFAVRDDAGHDLVDVRVFQGADLLTSQIDGRALALDPGVYALRFEADGYTPVKRDITVREREKLRTIDVVLESQPKKAPVAQSPVATHRERAFTPAVWALTGVAALGVAGLVGFGIAGDHKEDELTRTCKPTCRESEVDEVRRDYKLANASIALGGAALVAASVLYFVGREVPAERAQLSPMLARDGGGLMLQGQF